MVNFKKNILNILIFLGIFSCVLLISLFIKQYCNKNNEKIVNISSFKNKIIHNKTESKFEDTFQKNGYGLFIRDKNGDMLKDEELKSDKKPVSFFASIVNTTPYQDRIGFMIFINGQIQPFFIDGGDKELTFFSLEFNKNSYVDIPVTFIPKIDNFDKNTKIFFSMISLLDKKTKDKEPSISYFVSSVCRNFYDYKQIDNFHTQKDFFNLCKDIYPINHTFKEVKGDMLLTDIYKYENDRKSIINVNRKEKSELVIESAGRKGKYSTFLFWDDSPINVFEGQNRILWEISNNEMLKHRFTIDIPSVKGEHSLYTITVPLDLDGNFLYNSDKYIVNVN